MWCLPASLATFSTRCWRISAMQPSTVKITKPDRKLVKQFTELVINASLQFKERDKDLSKKKNDKNINSLNRERQRKSIIENKNSIFRKLTIAKKVLWVISGHCYGFKKGSQMVSYSIKSTESTSKSYSGSQISQDNFFHTCFIINKVAQRSNSTPFLNKSNDSSYHFGCSLNNAGRVMRQSVILRIRPTSNLHRNTCKKKLGIKCEQSSHFKLKFVITEPQCR